MIYNLQHFVPTCLQSTSKIRAKTFRHHPINIPNPSNLLLGMPLLVDRLGLTPGWKEESREDSKEGSREDSKEG